MAQGRQYTVLFSMTAAVLERLLGYTDQFRKRYLLRHYMVFLLFWVAAIYFFRLLKLHFKNHYWALLGTLLLLLCPRIFAHSFYNPKDIVLVSFYIISSYTLIQFFDRPNIKTTLWHALATALVINARMPGIIVPALSLLLILLHLIQNRFERALLLRYTKLLPLYLLVSAALTIALFPYLWLNPVVNSVESFELMAKFPWGLEALYFGEFYKPANLPWHYPFGWMLITIPPFVLLIFIIGLAGGLVKLSGSIKKWRLWQTEEELFFIAMLGLWLGPLTAIYLFNSNIYDDWRQLYFTFPPLLAISMMALRRLLKSSHKIVRYVSVSALAISMLSTAIFMVKNHPHQQVYFNIFAGKNLDQRFEMDYWGVAYKQAFEQLLAMDQREEPLHVYCANDPCVQNYKFLPDHLQEKIKLRWGEDVPQYFLSNFRWPKEFQRYKDGTYPYVNELFSIEVEGNSIIGIYKLREEPK